jgi:hypothetical protein
MLVLLVAGAQTAFRMRFDEERETANDKRMGVASLETRKQHGSTFQM